MAGFDLELPDDLVSNLKMITENTDEMFGRMTKAGADVVYKEVMNNMKSSFKSTKSLEKGFAVCAKFSPISSARSPFFIFPSIIFLNCLNIIF